MQGCPLNKMVLSQFSTLVVASKTLEDGGILWEEKLVGYRNQVENGFVSNPF